MPLLRLVLALLVLALPAAAQDRARTILVLDASGSMWGQIDGKTKIEIAQDVVGDLLDTLPADLELGLTAYGHNRKGDCKDIETLVEPGAATRDRIRAAVGAIRPKGKTPLSEAVIMAAEALRYTEEAATVILVSDGRETCDFDPCEVGRRLEEAGVNFTAHVVGFDVANPADRAQLQCLAENTGGRFITAANASELTEALQQVAAPPPPPVARDITFAAVVQGTGQRINDNLVWSLTDADGTALADFVSSPSITHTLGEGTYTAEVLRTSDEATAEVTIAVDAQTATVVLLELPDFTPRATLDAPAEAEVGTAVDVAWTGPADTGDLIILSEIGTPASQRVTQTGITGGSPAKLPLAADPGDYEIRYLWNGKVIARRAIAVLPVAATLDAADSGVAGARLQVGWTGPDQQGDYISVAEIGAPRNRWITYSYVRDGSPLLVELPIEPGQYELRYVMATGPRVVTTRPLTVTPVTASVTAPAEAAAGDTIAVDWQGPDYKGDYIAVAETGAPKNRWVTYSYTRDGSPARLRMPPAPGDYELRYVANQKSTVLATHPIRVVAVTATVSAPGTASAGDTVVVDWTGPDYQNDYVSVAEVGSPDNRYKTYTYTREGTPLRLKMPAEAGDYEIRYVQNQKATVLARAPITVTAVGATLTVPPGAVIGDSVLVGWSGPDYPNDYISVAEPGMRDNRYLGYTYTRQGAPLRLTMPLQPGTYEVRYVQNQGNTVLARATITLTPAEVGLSAADMAKAGENLLVQWTGPDYQNDYISVAETGDRDTRYVNYTYTRDGSPLRLQMPPRPGTYEIRYVANGSPSRVLARREVTVGPVEASVALAGEAKAGQAAVIDWTGPDYQSDYIAVSVVGDKGYETYAYTRDGTPLRVMMPKQPGTYELRYVMNQDRTILARTTIEVQ